MTIASLLSADAVRVMTGCSSKKRLLHALADVAESAYGLSSEAVIEALTEREALGPTGVGHGVALPHARLADARRIHGVFLRLERPLPFDAVDRQPVDLIFALIAPSQSGVEHLKALAAVSRLLRDRDLCATLRANEDAATLHSIMTQSRADHAA